MKKKLQELENFTFTLSQCASKALLIESVRMEECSLADAMTSHECVVRNTLRRTAELSDIISDYLRLISNAASEITAVVSDLNKPSQEKEGDSA